MKPPAPNPVVETKSAPAPKKLVARKGFLGQESTDNTVSGSAENNNPAASNAAALDEVEHEIDQLFARAGSVNSSLDNLQHQQAAAGYGLRGDIASHQASMKVNLSKAQNAIEHNDAVRAKRYADMTAADLEVLEKFLGR